MKCLKNAWPQYWYEKAIKIKIPNWVKSKEIDVYKEKDINNKSIYIVAKSIEELLNELGLNFNVKIKGNFEFPFKMREIVFNDLYDLKKIFTLNSAVFVLFKKYFGFYTDSSKMIKKTVGMSSFYRGISLVQELDNKENNIGLNVVIKHELAHLLGLSSHHLNNKCLMLPQFNYKLLQFNYNKLCYDCYSALIAFWSGIEEKTNKKYLKS
ncbi:MAG: hypothetical protein QW041_01895 [Candidatus Pacearchaeota archaeon]